MKKHILFLCSFLLIGAFVQGQMPVLSLDAENHRLNKGGPLPAETFFYVQGKFPGGANQLKIDLLYGGRLPNGTPIYSGTYAQSGTDLRSFKAPIAIKLSDNSLYDLRFTFFAGITPAQKEDLIVSQEKEVKIFLQNHAAKNMAQTDMEKLPAPSKSVRTMNRVFETGIRQFGAIGEKKFHGFSSRMEHNFKQLNHLIRIYQEHHDHPERFVELKAKVAEKIKTHLAHMQAHAVQEADRYMNGKFKYITKKSEFKLYPAKRPGSI